MSAYRHGAPPKPTPTPLVYDYAKELERSKGPRWFTILSVVLAATLAGAALAIRVFATLLVEDKDRAEMIACFGTVAIFVAIMLTSVVLNLAERRMRRRRDEDASP